ncbi:alpha/beta hydrolase [Streptomyces sp. NPDC000151]|uniref:alpha/beta hydrolase n=1 Tax=Streptomyces sp. NPDC000151 TaxID=3154244 RepID=UPI00332C7C40
MLFIHGARDPTCDYALARRAYEELGTPKALLTHAGADHAAYLNPGFPTFDRTQNTLVDWSVGACTTTRPPATASSPTPPATAPTGKPSWPDGRRP